MRVLGVDVGSTEHGFAVIDCERRGSSWRFVASGTGKIPASRDRYLGMLQETAPDMVAVERVRGVVYGPKGAGVVPHLIEAAWMGGGLSVFVQGTGLYVAEITAREWRQIVCHKPNASDPEVKSAITAIVHDWPVRSNVHGRDSAGVAVGAVLLGHRPMGPVRVAIP